MINQKMTKSSNSCYERQRKLDAYVSGPVASRRGILGRHCVKGFTDCADCDAGTVNGGACFQSPITSCLLYFLPCPGGACSYKTMQCETIPSIVF